MGNEKKDDFNFMVVSKPNANLANLELKRSPTTVEE